MIRREKTIGSSEQKIGLLCYLPRVVESRKHERAYGYCKTDGTGMLTVER